MGAVYWIVFILIIVFVITSIYALAKLSGQASNNHDDKEP